MGTLALACLVLLCTPRPADGFFRPSTRVKAPPAGPKSLSSLPQGRQQLRPPTLFRLRQPEEEGAGSAGRPLPLLVMSGTEEGAEDESEGVEDEEGDEDGVQVPAIEVPEMMNDEVRLGG